MRRFLSGATSPENQDTLAVEGESMVTMAARAPEFNLKGIQAGNVADYSLKSFPGKLLLLFFYPADFTFICPTEVTGFSKFAKEFRAEEAEVFGASVDSIETH